MTQQHCAADPAHPPGARLRPDRPGGQPGDIQAGLFQIESGITDVDLSRLQQIADVFGVPLIALFGAAAQVPAERPDTRILRDIDARESEILALQRKIIELYEELSNRAC